MKSAYELALERLESQGIERPDAGSLSDDDREAMAEARRRAEARLAELEILHKERLAKLQSFAEREEEERDYRLERRGVEEKLERELTRIRDAASQGPSADG
ncbi:MAG: hypothetical protein AAGC60_29135 [Acidobacteriota bacterium]